MLQLARTEADAPIGVPRVGRQGRTPDREMLEILGRDALSLSYRVRPMRGPVFSDTASDFLTGLDPAGHDLATASLALVDQRMCPRGAGPRDRQHGDDAGHAAREMVRCEHGLSAYHRERGRGTEP